MQLQTENKGQAQKNPVGLRRKQALLARALLISVGTFYLSFRGPRIF